MGCQRPAVSTSTTGIVPDAEVTLPTAVQDRAVQVTRASEPDRVGGVVVGRRIGVAGPHRPADSRSTRGAVAPAELVK